MAEVFQYAQRQEIASTQGNLALQIPQEVRSNKLKIDGEVVVDFTEYAKKRRKRQHEQARSGLTFQSNTKDYINFFNTFHQEEGLPQNWQNLQYGENQVGFSMDGQMNLLKEDDPEARKVWAKQT